MQLTATDKNLAIAAMERSVQDALEAAGAVSLASIETDIAGLRAAFATDPANVTGAQIDAAAVKLSKLVFPSMSNISAVFTEARTAV